MIVLDIYALNMLLFVTLHCWGLFHFPYSYWICTCKQLFCLQFYFCVFVQLLLILVFKHIINTILIISKFALTVMFDNSLRVMTTLNSIEEEKNGILIKLSLYLWTTNLFVAKIRRFEHIEQKKNQISTKWKHYAYGMFALLLLFFPIFVVN